MKWIKYQIVCNEDENVFIAKRVGYSEANLAIAIAEAYNGQYTIEDDGIEIEDDTKSPKNIDMQGNRIKNLGNPVDDNDAVSYGYVKRFSQTAVTDLEVVNNATTLDVADFDCFILENNYGSGIISVMLGNIERTSTTVYAEGSYKHLTGTAGVTSYDYSIKFTKATVGYTVSVKYRLDDKEWANVGYTKIYGFKFSVQSGSSEDSGEASLYDVRSIIRTDGDGSPGTTDTYMVTFTDGTEGTFTVYNGEDGKTPVKGTDYFTEADKAEMVTSVVTEMQSEIIEPADGDMPKVFLTGTEFSNMTKDKNEVNMEMDYRSKTKQFHAYIIIKYQGTSSLNYDKKNFTVKLFDDENRTNKQKHLFRDWKYAKNKFVLKANYIDHSHARNIVCANLWNEVVNSRSDYATLPEELRNSPKNGAIDGFPIKLYVNGTYQGVYTWNIGKDDWMWGMDEDNPNHVMLCVEHNTDGEFKLRPYNFRALWNGTDGYFEVEVGTAGTAVTTAINNLIAFVMNNDGTAFRNGIGQYLDVQSAIDYYIHQYVISGLDGLAKNMLLGTYDGKKWYCGAYDMDSTLGLFWNGTRFTEATYKCPEDYQEKFSLLWERMESNFWTEIKNRYAELRKAVYSVGNMFTHFERFMDTIGLDLYAEDLEIFTNIPCGSTNNIKQLRNFIRNRLDYCDQQITNGVPATGVTLSQTELALNAEAVTLKATITPSNATDAVLWLTSDASVATVSNGVVTPLSDGSCTIRAKCGSGYAVCEVTVSSVVEPETPAYTNLVDTALDLDTKTFTGTKYKIGHRVSSSGAIKGGMGDENVCLGYMKVESGATVRVKNVTLFNATTNSNKAIALFKSDFSHLGTACFQGTTYAESTNTGIFGTGKTSPITGIADGITTIKLPTSSDIYYIVVSGVGTGADAIVTCNEEIV